MNQANTPRILIYSTPTCPDCRALKEWLSQQGIAFEERDLTDPAVMAEATAMHDYRVLRALEERLRSLDAFLDQAIAEAKDRQALGILPPKWVFPYVISDARNVLIGGRLVGLQPGAAVETAAERLSGHKVTVTAVQAGTAAGTGAEGTAAQMASAAPPSGCRSRRPSAHRSPRSPRRSSPRVRRS